MENFISRLYAHEEGNIYIEEKILIKDTIRPQNVTNITASLNEDNTAIVLNWTNPAEDFDHVIIRRGSKYLTSEDFTLETFTDSDVISGMIYTYSFFVYDAFGNSSLNPPSIDVAIPTEKPILVSMYPEDNYQTGGTTLNYGATFRSDKKIERIVFEASKDGLTWMLLKDDVPTLYSDGYNVSGTWILDL